MSERLRAATIRSRLMFQVASSLVGMGDWPFKQALVRLRVQGEQDWAVSLLATDSPDGILEVSDGRVQFATLNPATAAVAALRGIAPFAEPVALRAIATLPSPDQLAFAISDRYGITRLEEIPEQRPPLRLSLRAQRNHAVLTLIDHTLQTVGFSVDDIRAWGGEVRYDEGLPHTPIRSGALAAGEVDAIFDEGLFNWLHLGLDHGLRFLTLSDATLTRLEQTYGYRRTLIPRSTYPRLPADVPTVDFSGFLIYTLETTPDDVVSAFCSALEREADHIAWTGGSQLPLSDMCRDLPSAPIPIPVHPAAERFWRARGWL